LFLAFGILLGRTADGEARPFATIFYLIWIAFCFALIVHAAKALRLIKKNKIEAGEIEDPDLAIKSDFATKLRELESLRREGLISDEEW